MNKILFIIGFIIGIAVGLFFLFHSQNSEVEDKTSKEYIAEHCDKLIHKNVRWAVCYRKGKIVATVEGGNIYEATKTRKYDYDKIEVFDRVGGSVVLATYQGRLYFARKPRCR